MKSFTTFQNTLKIPSRVSISRSIIKNFSTRSVALHHVGKTTRLSTTLIHADDKDNRVTDVAPPINVSTTFRYDNENLIPWNQREDFTFLETTPIYSRLGHPNSTRLESIFNEILDGNSVIYSSGLAAYYAALTYFNPKRLFIEQSYHGCHSIANIFTRNYGLKQYTFADIEKFAQPGDIVHLESPVNPFGTSYDIQKLADRTHAKGALLLVDSTFAPPPLQNVWDFGADIVMHSATKYFGGHSDLLSGVLVVKALETSKKLKEDRIYLGTNIGNLESFLLLRSLRTYELRIKKQSENAEKLVKYLSDNKDVKFPNVLKNIYHSSLQTKEPFVTKQLKGGFGPVFSIILQNTEQCKKLPTLVKYFHHATSLGGVESLIEWRALTDPEIDQKLIRISVGCENVEDLINDLGCALKQLNDGAS
ncbi:probable putative cystathionine beta-lyase [Saccharomycodes ludwigii]|uniref:Probable putative cystathionine beta-lyase n=1 Tax=Saccharomycodes ludwigii TaxID=36035 RepID=A0A376B7G1_9ASCO|nr:hypothetical protein SCDLUD_003204 [Saccharomycodes ludwigii]KAH3900233.1 hypothetical protein SCDLUD_003204 [Saccharomycodes ludwigii]SSD60561.1 probable putative cystathionine beta-lyase [Saccharomycodes ludwigii]